MQEDCSCPRHNSTRAANARASDTGPRTVGDFASRIVRDDVGGFDSQRIEKFREHLRLSRWTNFVILSGFGVTQSHEIWGDASPVSREAGYDTAPWEAVEREPVQEERCGTTALLDLCHPALFELNVSPELSIAICIHRRCLDTRWRGVAIRQESQNRETSELREKLSSIDHIT